MKTRNPKAYNDRKHPVAHMRRRKRQQRNAGQLPAELRLLAVEPKPCLHPV